MKDWWYDGSIPRLSRIHEQDDRQTDSADSGPPLGVVSQPEERKTSKNTRLPEGFLDVSGRQHRRVSGTFIGVGLGHDVLIGDMRSLLIFCCRSHSQCVVFSLAFAIEPSPVVVGSD